MGRVYLELAKEAREGRVLEVLLPDLLEVIHVDDEAFAAGLPRDGVRVRGV